MIITALVTVAVAILSPSVVVNAFAATTDDGNGGDGSGTHEPKVAHDKQGRPACGGCYIGKKAYRRQ